MRVLLIQSYTVSDEPPIYPLGLAYLVSHLRGNEIRFIDLNLQKNGWTPVREEISEFNPDIVGVSLRNIKVARPGAHDSCLNPHMQTIRAVKRAAPMAPLICGGSAFSLYAEWFMKHVPEIDLGVFGEGEGVFPRLLQNISTPGSVESVYFREPSGKVRFSGYGAFPDFSSMPLADRDVIPVRDYMSDPTGIGVLTKRGCPMQCIHCSDVYLLGRDTRIRRPEHVANEIEILVERFGVTDFMFNDQLFNNPLSHSEDICREMIRRRIRVRWSAWCSPKYVTKEFLELAEKAGCSQLSFSTDSVKDHVLKSLGKNYTSREIYDCHRKLGASRIPVSYNFMVNGPGDSLRSLLQVMIFVVKAKLMLGEKLRLHKLFIDVIRIYPHTKLRKVAVQRGIISSRDELIEPVFYNPAPVKYVVRCLTALLSMAWKIKGFVGGKGHKRSVGISPR